ncbi:MAG: hypothetical protein MK137_04625, partial [Rickettsiales bacterium]|nr:hypothetical protein [Rickettsiales bacterium]
MSVCMSFVTHNFLPLLFGEHDKYLLFIEKKLASALHPEEMSFTSTAKMRLGCLPQNSFLKNYIPD